MVTPTLTIKALHDRPKHPIDILIAVDIEDQSPFTIEAQERLGSGGKHLEPVRHDVLCIVDPSLLDSSGEQSPREFLERDIQMHDGLQLNRRILFCNSIRGLGLVEISREPIEHVAAIACRLDQRLSEHLKYQIVRYQIASPNVLDCLSSYFGICCDLPTQQLSAREVRNPVMVGKLGCLSAFAGAGWGN
jgi:hypothetical protein